MGKPVGNKSNQNVGVGRRQFLKVITITTGDQGVVCNGSVTLFDSKYKVFWCYQVFNLDWNGQEQLPIYQPFDHAAE